MEHAACSVCGLVPLAPRLNGATHVVAASPAMQALLRRAARFAAADAPVLITGETGTGKEVVARVLHANSARAAGGFVAVNVAALPAELLESELFGHDKGAFTGAASARVGLFEAAHQGTLFLDEIAEMPLPLQAKLLRALQDGEVRRVGDSRPFAVDARIVSATHRDLLQRTRAGLFREDLYYRLKVLALEVPPLRERREDLLPLAAHFLAARPVSAGARALQLTEAAAARLLAHDWPGNVRELENALRHGAALAEDGRIDLAALPAELVRDPLSARPASGALLSLAEAERRHILAVLEAVGGSPSEAARVLGVGRNTLWRKLKTYGG